MAVNVVVIVTVVASVVAIITVSKIIHAIIFTTSERIELKSPDCSGLEDH